MHDYATNNQSLRLKVQGSIVLLSLIIPVGLLDWSPLGDISKILLFPIVYSLLYALYDRLLWKFNPFDNIPILYGTWIGIADNQRANDLSRLEQMWIEQTWSRISVSIDVYELNTSCPNNWSKARKLGTESSTNAFIGECLQGKAKFNFQYDHDDEAKEQLPFAGSFFLRYEHKREETKSVYKLTGKYITTKKMDGYEGIFGRIEFRRISPKCLGFSDALVQGEHYLKGLAKDFESNMASRSAASFSSIEQSPQIFRAC